MRFITGLKNLSKNLVLLLIVITFIIFLFIFLIALAINITILNIIVGFVAIFFSGFTFILLILTIFFNLDERKAFLVITSIILAIPVFFLFFNFIFLFYFFCFFANLILTSFFAFKFCMDTSTTVDDYLYKKKSSRIFLRILEFIIFLLLTVLFVIFELRVFRTSALLDIIQRIFLILIVIDGVLLVFALIRLIFTKKFPAYISFFYLLTFIYILYVIISFSLDFLQNNIYTVISFFIDLFIFLYLLGSIFERVEYIKESIKIIGADTIALFVILMKSVVQIVYLLVGLGTLTWTDVLILTSSAFIILLSFAIFTLLIGLYKIFSHKEGKSSKHS